VKRKVASWEAPARTAATTVDGADHRPEFDLAVRQVEHVVAVIGAALGERLTLLPALPRAGQRIAYLQILVLHRLEHGVMAQLEDLSGCPSLVPVFELLRDACDDGISAPIAAAVMERISGGSLNVVASARERVLLSTRQHPSSRGDPRSTLRRGDPAVGG
jgi:hypothetical protein